MVLEDDDEGDGALDGDEEGGAGAAHEEISEGREAGRAEDGGYRDMAADEEDDEEDGDGGQSSKGRGGQEDAEAGGYVYLSN